MDASEDTARKGLIEGPWSTTEHGKKAEMKLEKNPCDVESWSILIREAQVRDSALSHKDTTGAY